MTHTDDYRAITELGLTGELLSRRVLSLSNYQATVTLSGFTNTYFDDLKRSHQTVHLNGRTNTVIYGCCGLSSETDWDGTLTSYEYDSLGRRTATIRHDIVHFDVLDAAGRVLERKRYGTNMSEMLLDQFAYDTAGRLARQTNALSGGTVFTNVLVNNKLQRTTTYPDGGQRVVTYYRDGRLEKITGDAAFPVRYDHGRELFDSSYREVTYETKLTAAGSGTAEWTKTYTDGAGRRYKTIYSAQTGSPYTEWTYTSKGQLIKERDPDGVTTLYTYNAKGEPDLTVVDFNANGQIDLTGTDRVTATLRDVTSYSGYPVTRTRTFVHTTDGSSATNLVGTIQTSTDGLRSWQIRQKSSGTPVVTSSVTAYGADGARTETVTQPGGAYEVRAYSYGRLISATSRNSSGGQVGQTAYTNDPHGRVVSSTDARNGTTSFSYNNADQITATTAPPAEVPNGRTGCPAAPKDSSAWILHGSSSHFVIRESEAPSNPLIPQRETRDGGSPLLPHAHQLGFRPPGAGRSSYWRRRATGSRPSAHRVSVELFALGSLLEYLRLVYSRRSTCRSLLEFCRCSTLEGFEGILRTFQIQPQPSVENWRY